MKDLRAIVIIPQADLDQMRREFPRQFRVLTEFPPHHLVPGDLLPYARRSEVLPVVEAVSLDADLEWQILQVPLEYGELVDSPEHVASVAASRAAWDSFLDSTLPKGAQP